MPLPPPPLPPPSLLPPPLPPPPPLPRMPSSTLAPCPRNVNKKSPLNEDQNACISDLNKTVVEKLRLQGVINDYNLAFCDDVILTGARLSAIEKASVLRLRSNIQKQILYIPLSKLPFNSAGESDYTVCSWGSDVYGRLGHGTDGQHTDKPKEVLYFKGTKLRIIESGAAHTIALSDEGHVWCWGKSHMDQVAVSHTLDEQSVVSRLRATECWPLPLLVQALMPTIKLRITHVAAGYQHCLALSSEGEVFSWGSLVGCGIGIPKERGYHYRTSSPTLVKGAITGVPIAVVAAGGKGNAGGHSVAIDRQGNVFGWGENDHCQLGIAVCPIITEPVGIPISEEYLPITGAAAGHAHTLLLSQSQTVLVAGDGADGVLGGARTPGGSDCKSDGVLGGARTPGGNDCKSDGVLGGARTPGGSESDGVVTAADMLGVVGTSPTIQSGVGISGGQLDGGNASQIEQDGTSDLSSFTPIPLLSSLPSYPQISTFARQCACVTEGQLYLWGSGWGEVPQHTPLPAAVQCVSVGERHVIAVLCDGTVFCWGGVGADSGDNKLAITGHGVLSLEDMMQPRKLEVAGAAYLGAASGNSTYLCLRSKT